jgi:hypothetical protein
MARSRGLGDVYKRQLGDSVYVEMEDGCMLAIYTDNGFGRQNQIYLEPKVRIALAKFLEDNDLN